MDRSGRQPKDDLPDALLDGGEEEWGVLCTAMSRRLARMPQGALLEVTSCGRRNRADIPIWCFLAGHDLIRMDASDLRARFWIRKGGLDSEA